MNLAETPSSRPSPSLPEAPRGRAFSSSLLRWGGGAAALVALVLLGRTVGQRIPELTAAVKNLGVWGPLVFVALYTLATLAFVPGTILTLAAGAIFGVVEGTLYVFLGATLGAALAFLLARHVARDAIQRRVAQAPRFAAVDRAIAREGRRIVFLLRLSPVFPFNLLNYALGLTSVRFRDYLAASVGMIPGTLLYVYTGKLAGEVAALAGGAAPERGLAYYAVFGLGLAATAAVTALVTRSARRALRAAAEI